jgi:hypothetical protein
MRASESTEILPKLPQNLDAERAVLGGILCDNSHFVAVADMLRLADFFLPEHQTIFRTMARLVGDGEPIDLLTVNDALEGGGKLDAVGGAAYIASLGDGVPRVSNVEHYARIVKDKANLRSLINVAHSVGQAALQEGAKFGDLLQLLENHSAHLRREVWAESNSLFRTPLEMASEGSTTTEWIVPGQVAEGASTELVGKVKLSGKTTYLLGMVEAIVKGKPFLGLPTLQGPVVYLTEQPRTSFCVALDRAGLANCDSLYVLHWQQVAGWSWPDVATQAVAQCKRRGAKVLIVDTIGQFSGIEGDSENDAGAAMAAMRPLQSATAEGVGVLVSRHERKSGGELGDSGRGSSAFAGAVDILLSVRRPEGKTKNTLRVIRGVGRLNDIPDNLVIELTPQGYVSRGQVSDVAHQEAEVAILSRLPDEEGEALTLAEFIEGTDVKRGTAQRVINQLREAKRVGVCGEGKKGSPFRFFRTEIHSAQTSMNNGQKETSQTVEAETGPM